MTDTTYMKPLPEPTPDTAPYWEGLRQGKLRLQACGDCGKVRHYPRPVCPHCHSMAVKWVDSKGTGKVHSWTVAHHAFHPGFKGEMPYTLVTVDLDDGVRNTRNDTRHDDEADPVTDSVFVNLLAQPHQEDRSRGQAEHADHPEGNRVAILGVNEVTAPRPVDPEHGLHQAQRDRRITRVFVDLLAARFPLLPQVFQRLISSSRWLILRAVLGRVRCPKEARRNF